MKKLRFLLALIFTLSISIYAQGQTKRTMYDKNGTRVLEYTFVNDINPYCSVPPEVAKAFPNETEFYSDLFSSACDRHDWGWSQAPWHKGGISGLRGKDIADERFLVDMRRACDSRFTGTNIGKKGACYSAAEIWYAAVKHKNVPDWNEKQKKITDNTNIKVTYSYTANGTNKSLGSNWGGTEVMTNLNGSIYAVQGGKLWKTSTSGSSSDLGGGWGGTEAMCSLGGYIFAVHGGKLYKTSASGQSTATASGWGGTEAMESLGGYVFAVQGGKLWKVGVSGKGAQECGSGWGGTEAMARVGSYIYAVQGGKLWRFGVSGKNSQNMGSGWGGTKAMASDGRYLYALQGGKLWRFDPQTKKSVAMNGIYNGTIKDSNWSLPDAMTSVGADLFIVQGGKLWKSRMK